MVAWLRCFGPVARLNVVARLDIMAGCIVEEAAHLTLAGNSREGGREGLGFQDPPKGMPHNDLTSFH